MVLAKPDERETWPYHCSLRLFMVVRSSPWGPIACWILAWSSLLVTWSLHTMPRILWWHLISMACNVYSSLQLCCEGSCFTNIQEDGYDKRAHQLYLETERNTPVIPHWFQPCQCCCLCYPGEYLKLGVGSHNYTFTTMSWWMYMWTPQACTITLSSHCHDEQMMMMSSCYCSVHEMQLTGCQNPVTTTHFVNFLMVALAHFHLNMASNTYTLISIWPLTVMSPSAQSQSSECVLFSIFFLNTSKVSMMFILIPLERKRSSLSFHQCQ